MKRLKWAIVLLALVVALSLASVMAACGSSGGSSESPSASASVAPTGPIKVGHIVNLTGPEAMVGQGQKKALEEAFKQMGPINGRTVEVITEDAKGEASGAVDAARKLVESDGVVAIFGPTEIGQKAAVGGYIKNAGIPELIYNPSPIEMFQGNKWIVGSGGGTAQNPSCMGDYLATTEGWKTINTLTEDNSAGRAFMDPLTAIFTQEGGKVLKQQWVPEDVGDFSPYLTTLPAADGLVAWEPGGAGIKLFSQWVATGLSKTMPIAAAFHGGFTDPFIPAALPTKISDEIVGTKAPQAYAPDNPSPENQAFQAAMTPVLGFPPADDGISGPYQAAMLFQAGVQKGNGDTSPETLLANILGSSIVGPEGAESFASGQQFATKTIYILEVAAVPGHAKTFTYKTVQTYEDVPPEGYTPQ